jgi:hypothetical protein
MTNIKDFVASDFPEIKDVSADDVQVGGSHYKDMGVQPWAVMKAVLTHAEWVGYLKGNVIKYGMRQGKKDSDDANKAKHYAQKLQEETNALGYLGF